MIALPTAIGHNAFWIFTALRDNPLRPAPDQKSARDGTAVLSGFKVATIVGATVFLLSLFGILIGPAGNTAMFWPTNAVVLGLLLRLSRLATPAGWTAAAAGYVLAAIVGRESLLASAAFGAVNMMSVMTAYWMYRSRDESILRLKRPQAVLVLVISVLLASVAASVAAAATDPFLFHRTILQSGASRFVTEVANYIAILPAILAAPDISWRWLERRRGVSLDVDLRQSLPIVAGFLSCAISMLVGGFGAVTFPVPALLWCAASYSVFTTALLTLGFNIWAVMTISPSVAHSGNLLTADMSIRIAVTLLALAPIRLAVVMEARNELMRRLLDIASRDQLTGLLNRHAFSERCHAALRQLGLDEKPVSLLMINIDHFKAVNEKHGYAAGDQALRSLSRIVSACLRGSDIFGRLGGEEFAVLLPDCPREDVQLVAERIRKAIAETAVDLGNNTQIALTASIGAASVAIATSDIDPLLLAADSALYRAKKTGRNRVSES